MMRVSPFIVDPVTTSNFVTSSSLSATSGASTIGFSPVGLITETTVQSAIAQAVSLGSVTSLSSGAITHLDSGSGGVATTAKIRFMNQVSVMDFGAVGDGSADDTVAIQAAINVQRGAVFFPKGTYKYSSLSCLDGTCLIGAGRTQTVLSTTLTTGETIKVNGKSNVKIESLMFLPGTSMSSGAVIAITNSHYVLMRDFLIYGDFYDGIVIEGGASQFITQINEFEIGNNKGSGIKVGVAALTQDTFISGGVIASSQIAGILLVYASGVFVSDVDIISCQYSVLTFPAAGQYVTAFYCTEVFADTSTIHGFALFDNGGGVGDVNLVNSWAATNGQHGLMTGANLDGLTVVGSRFLNNQRNGVYLQGGKNINFSGNQIYMNSMAATASYQGVLVDASTSHFILNSNRIGGPVGHIGTVATNRQGYGILIGAGTADYEVITGNDLTGNFTGAYSSGATGTNVFVSENLGVTAAAAGTVSSVQGRTGAVSLSATDINSALGYTPFNPGAGTLSSQILMRGAGLALIIDAPDSADQKIQFKNAGTVVGWLGSNATHALRVINGANTNLAFAADQSGSCTALKSLNAPLFIGTLSGAASTVVTITSGQVTGALGYTPVNPAFAGWTKATLSGSWTHLTAGYAEAGYSTVNPQGNVKLRGLVTGGSVPGTLFTLPSGSRPPFRVLYNVISNLAIGSVVVKTSGTVSAVTGNTAWISLDNLEFNIN